MVTKVKYKIKRDDIKNNPKIFSYSPYEFYHTIRIGEDGKETFNGNLSGYMIQNGVDGVPSGEYDIWVGYVEEYLTDHAEDVEKGKGFKIKFDITDVDDRYAYTYIEKVNGEIVRTDIGWGDDFETEAEEIAWIKAIKKYNKKNGIKMPTDLINEKIDRIRKMMDSLDVEIPEPMPLDIPLMEFVFPEYEDNPCEFVSDVKQASESAIATIAGMPAPKEIINYNIKAIKHNINVEIIKLYDSVAQFVKEPANQLFDQLELENEENEYEDSDLSYFDESDVYEHELLKKEYNACARFETVIEPPIQTQPIQFSYNGTSYQASDAGYTGGIYDYSGYTSTMDPKFKQIKKDKVKQCIKNYLAGQGISMSSLRFDPDQFVEICYTYNFDLPLMLAQCWVESFFGTTERAKSTNSIFSVGLYDNGQNAYTYATQGDSIVPYVKLVQSRYLQGGKVSVDQLLRNYVNDKGQRYASDRGYEASLTKTRNTIISKYPQLANWYDYNLNLTTSDYKEVNIQAIYGKGAPYGPSELVRSHVKEALKNLWVPLRKAWEEYAKKNLNIDPTWIITSGYRPVGYPLGNGKKQTQTGSAHIVGYAIDVQPRFNGKAEDKRDKVHKLASFLKSFLAQNRQLGFDQILVEYSGGTPATTSSTWCHIGYKNQQGSQRREFWMAYNANTGPGKHGQKEII